MSSEGVPLRRPTHPRAKPQYHLRAKNKEERALWEAIAVALGAEMAACYDHLANRPTVPLPDGRCHQLHGQLAGTWQYKPRLGHNYRIWYVVDKDRKVTLVTAVHDHHP